MLFTQPRAQNIILLLDQQHSKGYTSSQFLANNLGVTTRTIRNDIKNLNNQLKKYHVEILHKRDKGYYFKINDRGCYISLLKNLKQESHERGINTVKGGLNNFILLILTKKITKDEICNTLFISEASLKKYLNDARKILKNYHLRIQERGNLIEVIGPEYKIRSCLIDHIDDKKDKNYVRGFSSTEKRVFDSIDLTQLSDKTAEITQKLGFKVSDFSNKNVVIHLALSINRALSNNQMKRFDRNPLSIKKGIEHELRKFFKKILNFYNIEPNENEYEYFLNQFALNYPEILSGSGNKRNIDKLISNTVIAFLDKIKDIYVFNLTSDKELINNLEKHMNLLLKVKKVKEKRINPLLDVITSTFPLAYEMTVVGSPILEKGLGLKLSKDELAFIALHIGASMERLYDNRWTKKKVALVCGSGTATARILKLRLEAQFKEYMTITGIYSLYEFKKAKHLNDDFVISTVPIFNSSLPVVQVDLSNFTRDSLQLYEYLISVSNQKQLVMKLFDNRFIYIVSKKMSKDEILDLMVSDLEKEKIVNKDFRKNIYKRESLYSTVIGGEIATPHPIKYSGIESKVSFAKMKYPVNWDGKPVKYIFLISIAKEDYSNIQDLFTLLVDLQDNKEFRHLIDRCKTKEEVKEAIRTILQTISFNK